MIDHLKQSLFRSIDGILAWLSSSNDNALIGVTAVAVLYLMFYYTLAVTPERRVNMSPFAHFINLILSPIIGSTIALALMQGAEYWTNESFYTLYFLRSHSESLVHSFRISVAS